MIPSLAFIALRSPTDSEAALGELTEVAVLRTEPFDGVVTDVFSAKVRSTHPSAGIDTDEQEQDALWLVEVMNRVRDMTAGCALVAFDAGKTRERLDAVCQVWDLIPLDLSPIAIDLRSLLWPALLEAGARDVARLDDVCQALKVAPKDGSVAEEAHLLADLYRLVRGPLHGGVSLEGLNDDERFIVKVTTRRMRAGRQVYGPWKVASDQRRYPQEALMEVMDALHYCAAQLRKMDRTDDGEEPVEAAS